MKIGLSLLILFGINITVVSAQLSQLSVYKPNGQLATRIFPGEYIGVKTRSGWYNEELIFLLQDSLVIGDRKLALSEIEKIRQPRLGLSAAGFNLALAGVIWPGIVAINGLNVGARPLVTSGAITGSAIMLGSGAILLALSKKSIKTTAPGRLRIVHFNFGAPQPIVHP